MLTELQTALFWGLNELQRFFFKKRKFINILWARWWTLHFRSSFEGIITWGHFPNLKHCKIMLKSLRPKRSLLEGPGPYKDLFGVLGPYWVLIYVSGSLFSVFWLHSRKECQFSLHVYIFAGIGSGWHCWQIWLLGVLIGSLFKNKWVLI